MQRYDRDVKDIHSRQGESFMVVLPSLPGAGYSWRLDAPGNLVRLVSHTVQPASNAIGAAAFDEFVFHSLREGSTTLEFEYGRSWEKSLAEKWHVVLTIGSAASGNPTT